ncbi:MAG TPA: glycosyltransferase [Opitutus sp.]|nr:glycosyltransferase [Opitutus sp.]
MKLVVIGLSITSSWGNGHATTYRALLREMARRGHDIVFLEQDQPWYAAHRDLCDFPYATVELYSSLADLRALHATTIADADAVMLGSYVPDGAETGSWLCATARGLRIFYDLDTPVTLAKLRHGEHSYIAPAQIPDFDLYLSFAGGPALERLEQEFGAVCARPLYCAVDAEHYRPMVATEEWELGYLGTYSADRQAGLEELLFHSAALRPGRRFVVAGAQYPSDVHWAGNVSHINHLPPAVHPWFYNAQRFTLNLTRREMAASGFSPSVRLFEAAACGTPVITDPWTGLDSFFSPGTEILVAPSSREVISFLAGLSAEEAQAIGAAARDRVLRQHTAAHRASELEHYLQAIAAGRRPEVLVH